MPSGIGHSPLEQEEVDNYFLKLSAVLLWLFLAMAVVIDLGGCSNLLDRRDECTATGHNPACSSYEPAATFPKWNRSSTPKQVDDVPPEVRVYSKVKAP